MHFDKETQIKLLKKFRNNDDQHALNLLLQSNERLVYKMANSAFAKCGLDIEDLRQEARVGMLLAAQKFDFNKDVAFTTYAQYWINHRLIKYAMQNRTSLTIGKTNESRILFLHFARTWNALSGKRMSQEQKHKYISEKLNVRFDSVVKFYNMVIRGDMRLDMKLSEGSDAAFHEKISGEEIDVAEVYEDNDALINFKEVLCDMMDNDFEEHERDIIKIRYLSGDLKSYSEVARQTNRYTRQQITNIDRRLIDKIQKRVKFRTGLDIGDL